MTGNIKRPAFDTLNRRIRYADSPANDAAGNPVLYEVDHSDPTKWDQTTGLPTDTEVAVAVTRTAPTATTAPTTQETPQAGPVATVTAAATDGLGEPGRLNVAAGTSVADARTEYARRFGTPEGSKPHIGGQEVTDGMTLKEGDVLIMKVPVKERG